MRHKRIALLIAFVILIVLVRLSPLGGVLTFENLRGHRDELAAGVQAHYVRSAMIYICVYVLATALSIPGAVILTLAGGLLFGVVAATVYVNIGATGGAVLAFLSARYLLGNRLQEKYRSQLARFNDETEKNGSNYLLTLRLIPLFPFFLINFLAGLTTVRLRTFLWTTSLGIVPGTAVFAFAGRQIGSINAPSEIVSPKVLAAFAALALFALVPVFWKRLKRGGKGAGRS